MAETVNQETNGTAAETQENEQRTFTQAEMNAIIAFFGETVYDYRV